MSEGNMHFFYLKNLRFEYPINVRFECSRCGSCCGDTENMVRRILLLKDDVKLICIKTGLRTYEFAERCEGSEPYIYEMRKNSGKCVFYKDGVCQIYTFRPLICKFYPFQLKNPEEDRFVFSPTDACSGLGKGDRIEKEFFEELSTCFLEKMHHK